MNYYGVRPATNRYHGELPLTYSYSEKLNKKQIVEIKIKDSTCLAIIENQVPKPEFKVNNIERKINDLELTDNQLELFKWLQNYYPENTGAIARLFAPGYLSKYAPAKRAAYPKVQIKPIRPELNKEQLRVYKKIKQSLGTFLLNGVTGSGKTRIYLELARNQINSGRSVLILTPEIALTAPLEQEFKKTFNDKVLTNHSNLTQKQKLEIHQKIYQANNPLIVIGPRSSLFLPVRNLGLIIVDEFHETSYKQESSPRYLATRVASKLSQISSSTLLFGSATPSVNDYYIAEQKKSNILNIYTSAITNKRPEARETVVDLSDKNEQTSYPLISRTAISKISEALEKNEQVLVYINKRGSFRSILCKNCGWQFKCRNCDLPLIYHQDINSAVCHTCGYRAQVPKSCFECGSIEVFFTSPGTKSIAGALSKIFPDAKIGRYDKDNKKSERLESNFQSISDGDVDILVGTQMISKGFDLPKLSIVVMLITESALNFPDYTSNERSYQLIKQLAGRVNRGHRKGEIILQTFTPKSEIINYSKKDWIDFYKEELAKRKILGFPPFFNALKIQAISKTRLKAEAKLSSVATDLNESYNDIKILGPSPSFIEKKINMFHWQLVIMSKNRSTLVEITRKLPKSLKKDLDPINFL
ncbi:MAG TPA: primosomal protein N' [Candidatus Saccharimonadales bacterium]|nr:primosomal protein N' [Candidatus Saccharimonadales bacterium]